MPKEKNMPGHEKDKFFKHHWIRFDDGSEEDRILAQCKYCDSHVLEGGCRFTQKEWDALAPEDKTELAVAKL